MDTAYTTIYLIRHGESVWNVRGLVQGQKRINENTLTEKGETQAKAINFTLQHIHFKVIFSSDLLRAKRTAEIISIERNLLLKTTVALREKAHGEFEGTNSEDYLKLFTKWAELSDEERMSYKITEKGETPAEAMTRFIIFLKEISLAYKNEIVLVVTHGGLMRDFLVKLGKKTYDDFKGFKNTGYIKLRSNGVEFFIDEVNGLN
jgi:broad specificity phosphatase PhoE